jgi:hypothetical protein
MGNASSIVVAIFLIFALLGMAFWIVSWTSKQQAHKLGNETSPANRSEIVRGPDERLPKDGLVLSLRHWRGGDPGSQRLGGPISAGTIPMASSTPTSG